MVQPADWDCVFIAHLSAESTGLSKPNVMGLGWRAAAHNAWLGPDELAVLLVAQATITNIEVGRYAGNQDSLEQIESVFRNGGIEFLADNGVRLLKPEVTKEGGADRESRRIAPRLRRRAGR